MPLATLLLAILICLFAFADVLSGSAGSKRLRNALYNFYFSVEIGDWAILYRAPASGVLTFMDRLLGTNPLDFRYVVRSTLVSIVFTSILYAASLVTSYGHVLLTPQHCKVPGVGQFLEIGPYMWNFLKFVYVSNAMADYVTWSITQALLRALKTSRPGSAAILLFCAIALASGAVFFMYLIYLPMSIMVEAWAMGVPFGLRSYTQILLANKGAILSFFTIPDYVFSLGCASPTEHTIFRISEISTMRIVAVEVIIPVVLLISSSLFGILATLTRPITKAPLSYVVARLEEYPRGAIIGTGVLLSAIAALIAAAAKYMSP